MNKYQIIGQLTQLQAVCFKTPKESLFQTSFQICEIFENEFSGLRGHLNKSSTAPWLNASIPTLPLPQKRQEIPPLESVLQNIEQRSLSRSEVGLVVVLSES
jgi:hypothetical protein